MRESLKKFILSHQPFLQTILLSSSCSPSALVDVEEMTKTFLWFPSHQLKTTLSQTTTMRDSFSNTEEEEEDETFCHNLLGSKSRIFEVVQSRGSKSRIMQFEYFQRLRRNGANCRKIILMIVKVSS